MSWGKEESTAVGRKQELGSVHGFGLCPLFEGCVSPLQALRNFCKALSGPGISSPRNEP
jgi:hypothetical protein